MLQDPVCGTCLVGRKSRNVTFYELLSLCYGQFKFGKFTGKRLVSVCRKMVYADQSSSPKAYSAVSEKQLEIKMGVASFAGSRRALLRTGGAVPICLSGARTTGVERGRKSRTLMSRIEAAVGRLGVGVLLYLGQQFPLHGALTRLDVSYYTDYAVNIRVDGQNDRVYASALTASYLPGARGGAKSTPLRAGNLSSFTAFSLDIGDDLVSKGYWEPGTLQGGNEDGRHDHDSPQWVPGGIYRAASLYDAYVGEVNSYTSAGKLAGAALQLAIWDVLYGDGEALNHRRSGFYVSDRHGSESQLIFAANAMLSSAANFVNLGADATFWDSELGPNGRRPLCDNPDLIGPGMITMGAVPEASGWFAATGAVAGLYALSAWSAERKKLRKKRHRPNAGT
jgi:hypothetical protein